MPWVERHYPPAPVVGVGGVVVARGHVLLIKRGAEPAKGIWSIPGGAVELGEGLREALVREVREETGIEVLQVGPLVEVVERLFHDEKGRLEYHYVLLDYLCFTDLKEPLAASDAAAARWTPVEDLESAQLTRDTLDVIRKALALADARGG